MTDCTEDLDNQYIFTAIIVIRENNKHPGIKAIKDYINKNFVSGIEGGIIEDIAMELLDHTITENRTTTKGNSYFITICYPTRKNHFQQSKIKDSTLLKLKSLMKLR